MTFNVLLQTQFYIGWKFLGFMKDHEIVFFTSVLRNNFFNPLGIHCGYVEIETIVPLSIL